MTDFQLQQGVVSFELPSVIPDFLNQIQLINQKILLQAQASFFSYTYPTLPYLSNQQIPDMVYNLMNHFMKRGFVCEYDGDLGQLTFAWDHPEMSDLLLSQITYASPSMLSTLSGWFEAGVVYLCQTGGVDLRSSSIVTVKRQIQTAVEKAATVGLTSTTWGFSTVPPGVVNNLYAEIFDQLYSDGFGVTYNSVTGLYNIVWDDGSMYLINYTGDEMDHDLETSPNGINTGFNQIYYHGSTLNLSSIITSDYLAGISYDGSSVSSSLSTSSGSGGTDTVPPVSSMTYNTIASLTNTMSLSITTSSNQNMLLVVAICESTDGSSGTTANPFTSVTADGLTFTQYLSYTSLYENNPLNASINFGVWWAPLTAAGTYNVTAQTATNWDDAGMFIMPIQDANLEAPFLDGGSTGLPVQMSQNTLNGGITSGTIDVPSSGKLLLAFQGIGGPSAEDISNPPFSQISTFSNTGGANYCYGYAYSGGTSGYTGTITAQKVNQNAGGADGTIIIALN